MTLFVAEENLLQRFNTDNVVTNNRRIHAICRAVEDEENNAVDVTFEIRENGTVRCSFRGTLERVNRARSLMEYKLSGGRQHDMEPVQGMTPLSIENLRRLDNQLTEKRQFACQRCEHIWWRKTFSYKPVSNCQRCQNCYNPIPYDQMYGWGRFVCQNCGNVFTGYAVAGRTSPCFRCGNMVLPESIGPRPPLDRPRGSYMHACEECDNGRIRPCPARANRVYSEPHDCSGSTVSTFLTQSEVDI